MGFEPLGARVRLRIVEREEATASGASLSDSLPRGTSTWWRMPRTYPG